LISWLIIPKAESILLKRTEHIKHYLDEAEVYNNQVQKLEAIQQEHKQAIDRQIAKIHQESTLELEKRFELKKQELATILDQKRANTNLELQNYIKKFHKNERKYKIELAAIIIQKITNKQADIEILNTLDTLDKTNE
jgi:F0F1-type ATP synthase membrane subunit b/b'